METGEKREKEKGEREKKKGERKGRKKDKRKDGNSVIVKTIGRSFYFVNAFCASFANNRIYNYVNILSETYFKQIRP